jgi:hypothetical protein
MRAPSVAPAHEDRAPDAGLRSFATAQDLDSNTHRCEPRVRFLFKLAELERGYWIELATLENALLALVPMSRTVPTTITRITANITAYSAMS